MSFCTIADCNRKVRAHGLCNMHDLRMKRNGNAQVVKRVASYEGMTCSAPDCSNPILSKWLCVLHYNRWRDGRSLADPAAKEVQTCQVEGCNLVVKCLQLCDKHYRKQKYNEYRTKHPWRYRAYGQKRRQRMRDATPWPISEKDVEQRMLAQGQKCWMCGNDADTIDHVKPLAAGGLHILANLRPACLSCNSRKRSKWNGIAEIRTFIIN